MRHAIHDELYIEIEKCEVPEAYNFKLIRQYDNQEPVVSFTALLFEKDIANFITGLQKAVMFSPDPDSSKNFGQH